MVTDHHSEPAPGDVLAVRHDGATAVICACHSSRNATTSSWVRPTKFHHITIDSPNGSPPSNSSRDRLVVRRER